MNNIKSRSCLLAIVIAVGIPQSVFAQAQPQKLDEIYERVSSSVVFIIAKSATAGNSGSGSGVVLHRDGYIATAAHVVDRVDEITVQFQSGERQTARTVTFSRSQDLALLKVDAIPAGTHVSRLADSDRVKPGQAVFFIGAPRGLQYSLSSGIVSALRKGRGSQFVKFSADDFIQSDAAVNPGSSGGPLFDMNGEVIGIAVSIRTTDGDFAGISMAVPSALVRKRLFNNALPFIGVYLRRIPGNFAKIMNWPPYECLLVEGVQKGSAAETAGLRGGVLSVKIGTTDVIFGGDLIYEAGGIPIKRSKEVHNYLHNLKEGDQIEYTLWRDGKMQSIKVPITHLIPVPTLEAVKPAKATATK